MFLSELKKGKNLVLVLLIIMLLTIPLYIHIYYMSQYYIIIVLVFIPLTFLRIIKSDFLEKRFYSRWEKRRNNGRLFNIIGEGFRTILLIIVVVFSSQFIVNGRTPGFIISKLPINVSMGLMVFLFILGIITGIFAWYENEKRFYKSIMKYGNKENINS